MGGLLILLFTQCRRKPKSPNITDWLEKEYPNRFEVLDTYTRDVIRHLSFSVKGSFVAEKSNPLIQVNLHWDKRVADIELSKSMVDSAFAKAHREYNDAQSLYKSLQSNGLHDIAVGMDRGMAKVLIFAEPTPEHRQNSLILLEKGFAEWQKEEEHDINIYYLEPTEKDKSFKEIVPLLYWYNGFAEFKKNMLYWIVCPATQPFSAKEFAKKWKYNTSCNRFVSKIENARKDAQKWASEHIKRPFTLLETVEFDQSYENMNLVKLKFPLVYKPIKEEETDSLIEIEGYISMNYKVEENTFGQIKLTKE